MTINFLGSGSSYRQMSFTWGGSVDWSTLLIPEISRMAHEFVKWPAGAAMRDTCQEFERMRGLKGCCGCIDGSFIKIRAPWMQSTWAGDYNTYKKFYAIQLLAVCAANMLFTFVHTGTPGLHSSTINACSSSSSSTSPYPTSPYPTSPYPIHSLPNLAQPHPHPIPPRPTPYTPYPTSPYHPTLPVPTLHVLASSHPTLPVHKKHRPTLWDATC